MILSPPNIIKELIHIAYYDLHITYKTEFLILIKLEQLKKNIIY